jgi:hypothetical protein
MVCACRGNCASCSCFTAGVACSAACHNRVVNTNCSRPPPQQEQEQQPLPAWLWAKRSLTAVVVAMFVMHFGSKYYVRVAGVIPFGFVPILHRGAAAYVGKYMPAPVAVAGAAIVMQAARCPHPVPSASVHHHGSTNASEVDIPVLQRSDHSWFQGYAGDTRSLFVGPSGSGKSTSFQIALSEMQRPCVYLAGRKVGNPWAAIASSCGVSEGLSANPERIRDIIEPALQILHDIGWQPMAIFIDDVHGVFDLHHGDMALLATFLLEMSIQGLISVNFASSEARATLIVKALPGFSKRFKTEIVPYALLSDVTVYLKNQTLLKDGQVTDVIHVTGASLHDVGIVVARFLNASATDDELSNVLDSFVMRDALIMNLALDGTNHLGHVTTADSISVCSVVFESLRETDSVPLNSLLSKHQLSVSYELSGEWAKNFLDILRWLVSQNLLLELPGLVFPPVPVFMFHDPCQRRTYERLRPEPVQMAVPIVDVFTQYPDAIKMEEVVRAIAKLEGYSEEEVTADVKTLLTARVKTVGNLRALSVEQIKELGLPPVVTAYMQRVKKGGK